MFYAILANDSWLARVKKRAIRVHEVHVMNRYVLESNVLYNFESSGMKLNYNTPCECAYFANSYSDETVLNNSFRILSAG